MIRILFGISLLFTFGRLCVQGYNEITVPISELLQYQQSKAKFKTTYTPFSRYGFSRINASYVLDSLDNVTMWGYQVSANLDFDKDNQPLFRLFRKNDMVSMAVIDCLDGYVSKCQIVFWSKRYYHRIVEDLRNIGFIMYTSPCQSNRLEFRKEGVTVGADVVIWSDIYLLELIFL